MVGENRTVPGENPGFWHTFPRTACLYCTILCVAHAYRIDNQDIYNPNKAPISSIEMPVWFAFSFSGRHKFNAQIDRDRTVHCLYNTYIFHSSDDATKIGIGTAAAVVCVAIIAIIIVVVVVRRR